MNPKRLFQVVCLGLALALSRPLAAENSVDVGDGSAEAGEVAAVPLRISTDEDAQGFIMAFDWNRNRGTGVDLAVKNGDGEALASAELVQTRVEDNFMVLAVVLDLDGQGGEVIPAAQDIEVGEARIRCDGPEVGSVRTSIHLEDNKYGRVDGGPLLTNTISQGGRSITEAEGLLLKNGSFTCEGGDIGEGEPMLACGGPLGDDGMPGPVAGGLESTQTMTFYYKSERDLIQGLSIGVKYSCALTLVEDSFSVEGGVLAAGESDAEFVHFEVDDDATHSDGDGCELTVGILVDAVSPFDGRSLPRTSDFQKLFDVDFLIEDDAPCGDCAAVRFLDGVDGNDGRPVDNLVSVEFFSKRPQTMNCEICIQGRPKFIRGDCNFSGGGAKAVDIADAAAVVGFVFLEGDARFAAPCEDACDANDDGRLDAADIVYVLEFLFVPGSPEPPAPGPERAGVDPTQDELGCEGGELTCGS